MTMQKLMIHLLVIAGMFYQTTTFAAQQEALIQWILVGDSVHLDRSTRYLANGYTGAAIRHAKKALRSDNSALHNLIANHNLCIALAKEGDSDAAGSYCETAARMTVPQLYLKRVKQGFYRVKQQAGDELIELKSVIVQNLRAVDSTKVAQLN